MVRVLSLASRNAVDSILYCPKTKPESFLDNESILTY